MDFNDIVKADREINKNSYRNTSKKKEVTSPRKEDLRIILLVGGEHKGRRGYYHGMYQYGNLEYGLEAYVIVELSDGYLVREPIEYIKFEGS